MKNISINKKRIKAYAIVAALFYALLGAAYAMRGVDNYPVSSLPSLIIMPFAILFIGITDINIKKPWIKVLLTVLLCLYIPEHIINFVLGDFKIKLAEHFYYNCLMVFGVFALFMALTMSIRASALICCIMCFFIYTINTYVTAFRGMAVTPGDFYALSTALKVAGGYKYFINIGMVSSVMYTVVLIQLINRLCISLKGIIRWKSVAARLICAALCVFSCSVVIKAAPRLASGLMYNAFDPTLSNERMGTILAFITNVEHSKTEAPQNYDRAAAEKILADTDKAEQTESEVKKPHVIVIMNEAFCDMNEFYEVGESEDPLKNWHGLRENTVSGNMFVSVKGGGTSYTEFEFLTGLSGGILPINRTPYLDFIKGNTHSLAWDMKKEGYTTVAVHPFWSSCWNRGTVYPMLGFDDFISGEDFSKKEKGVGDYNKLTDEHITTHTDFGDDLEYIRTYISDRESYKKVIEQFENKKDGEKLFVFNVTVQNHSGFDYEGEDFKEDVTSSADESKTMKQYLSLLKQSDIAYGELTDYFKNYEEPVVILMFGDHQPGIPFAETSLKEQVKEEYKKYANDDSFSHRFIVPYKLWANYDIPEEENDMTCSSYLSLMLKEKTGIGFNKWDDFRMKMKESFGGVTAAGFMQPGCTELYSGGDNEKDEIIKEYELLEYYLLFDRGMMD